MFKKCASRVEPSRFAGPCGSIKQDVEKAFFGTVLLQSFGKIVKVIREGDCLLRKDLLGTWRLQDKRNPVLQGLDGGPA